MTIETGFAHAAQALLWPVMALLALAFVYALWAGGATLMEAWQRRRRAGFATLSAAPSWPETPLEELELFVVRRLEPVRLLSRVSPMLGLIATMIPLGPALQAVAGGQGQQALAVFSGAFAGVTLALAAAAIGLAVYSVRRHWLLAELLAVRKARGVAQ
jgi:biopolymer transport protein ExbB/TolQ